MSKKRKQQEELAKQQAMQQQQQQIPVRPVMPQVRFRIMSNCAPVPVARPADFIQLTPIVQPVPLVPYSSQMQPLAQYDDDGYNYNDYYDEY